MALEDLRRRHTRLVEENPDPASRYGWRSADYIKRQIRSCERAIKRQQNKVELVRLQFDRGQLKDVSRYGLDVGEDTVTSLPTADYQKLKAERKKRPVRLGSKPAYLWWFG